MFNLVVGRHLTIMGKVHEPAVHEPFPRTQTSGGVLNPGVFPGAQGSGGIQHCHLQCLYVG